MDERDPDPYLGGGYALIGGVVEGPRENDRESHDAIVLHGDERRLEAASPPRRAASFESRLEFERVDYFLHSVELVFPLDSTANRADDDDVAVLDGWQVEDPEAVTTLRRCPSGRSC